MRIFVFFLFMVASLRTTSAQEPTAKADVILQLFQWPWNEVKRLCTGEVLSLGKGIRAVQVSSPQPHRIIHRPLRRREVQRPWWERYQPTSLTIGNTRGGAADEFRTMVTACRDNGIEVYSEIVINHLLAIDAGLGRSTSGNWFAVDDARTTLTIDDSPYPGIQGKETEHCPNLTGLLSETCYEPPYTLEGEAGRLLKLNLTSANVQADIKLFLQSLLDAGVTGFSVSSATLSSPTELQTLFWQLLYNGDGTAVFDQQPVVYLELADKSEVETEMLLDYTSHEIFGQPDISAFSYGSASKIVELFKLGAPPLPDDPSLLVHGMQNIYNDLSVFATTPRIAAFEHHEQVHGRAAGNPYASLEVLSPSQRTIATMLLLLSHPDQAGRPRLLWDYTANFGLDWQGPPSSPDFTIKSPLVFKNTDDTHYWRQEYLQGSWIFEVAELRWKWFFERRTSTGYAAAERTFTYELRPTFPADPNYVVLAYVVPVDIINLPNENFIDDQCKVGIILVSLHRDATGFNGDEPQLAPGTYLLDEFEIVTGDVNSIFPLTDQSICSSRDVLVTDYESWPENKCIELRRTGVTEETPDGRTEIVLPELGFTGPQFVVFEAQISSDFICYNPNDY